MHGLMSESAAALIITNKKNTRNIFFDLISGNIVSEKKAFYSYSAAKDWKNIECDNLDKLLELSKNIYWSERSASLIRMVLSNIGEPLSRRVFEEVEENFIKHTSPEKVLSRLLIAPLNDGALNNLKSYIKFSSGFPVTFSLLDQLRELQPLIRRFTNVWLDLSDSLFLENSIDRKLFWKKISEEGLIGEILESRDPNDFRKKWNLLSFVFSSARERAVVNSIAKSLSDKLFPKASSAKKEMVFDELDPNRQDSSWSKEVESYNTFLQVKKQIEAITQSVSKGLDSRADKFLRELVDYQLDNSSEKDYVLKSLCNIAKRSADMFRLDYEKKCLDIALEIDPFDAWTLAQYGDFYKRTGQYDLALEKLDQAKIYGEDEIAVSSTADVYSQQSDYIKAIDIYKTIPDYENTPQILTAIADNTRKMGDLDAAQEKYFQLIERSYEFLDGLNVSSRAWAGLAEVHKRKGDLDQAIDIYDKHIDLELLEPTGRVFNSLAFANILKAKGEFERAFELVDNVVNEFPFAIEARFLRGAILGLLGKEQEGLDDLPEGGENQYWREWLRYYYRGLLLLKLKRYDEAKQLLVDQMHNAIASNEERSILRMAASLYYICSGDTNSAENMLSENLESTATYDSYRSYLSLVLSLHCAAQKDNVNQIKVIKRQLSGFRIVDPVLNRAIVAIDAGELEEAIIYETHALLKLAA